MEGQELSDIGDAIRNFDPINVGDLFLKITGFGASLKQHMFKEEEHILPRLLQALNDDELSGLRLQMDMELHQMCQRSKPFDSLQRRIPNRDSQEWEYCFESSRSKDSVSDFFD